MTVKSEEVIMSANSPYQIFSMQSDKMEEEFEEYREVYKPQAYSSIQNFIIMQKVTMLYRQALELLEGEDGSSYLANSGELVLRKKDGVVYTLRYSYVCDTKVSKMYVADDNVIFVLEDAKWEYYSNYLEKTKRFSMINERAWKTTEHMLPKVVDYFETVDNLWVIVLKKPCNRMYSLREILDYFGGRINPEYVASILNRLYHFICYLEIAGLNHNAITIDNLFFAPGHKTEKGEKYTVEDMRIVGVFGGWFFSTWSNEKMRGLPKDVYDVIPSQERDSGYSSFKVDALAVKRVARELLGDSTGENFVGVPEPMVKWLNRDFCEVNAYEEYSAWEAVNIESFGKRRFVEMDVSIN